VGVCGDGNFRVRHREHGETEELFNYPTQPKDG
jgi:hypothetical protein